MSISSVEIWPKILVVGALRLGGRAAKISKICMFLIGQQNTLSKAPSKSRQKSLSRRH